MEYTKISSINVNKSVVICGFYYKTFEGKLIFVEFIITRKRNISSKFDDVLNASQNQNIKESEIS